MRIALTAAVVALALGCDEPRSFDNRVVIELNGERHDWRTDDGGCQIRNMSSLMTCRVAGDLVEGEDDFSLSLNVGLDAEIEERSYTDDPAEAFPDVTASVWFPNADGPERLDTDDSVREPLVLTLTHFGRSDVEGSFDLHMTTGEGEPAHVTGTLDMVLVE